MFVGYQWAAVRVEQPGVMVVAFDTARIYRIIYRDPRDETRPEGELNKVSPCLST